MSENEKKKTEWFVDPNSGAASQPGGFVSPAVRAVVPEETSVEETPAEEVEETVAEEVEETVEEEELSTEEVPAEEGAPADVETSTAGSLNPRLGTSTEPEPEPEVEPEPQEDFSEVLSGNLQDVRKFLEANPDKREALIEAEKAGKNRSGIVEG